MEQGKAANNTSFLRELLPLAVPIILQSLFSTAVGLADSFMLNFVGQDELAAVSLANQPQFVLICPGVRIGANSVIGAGSVVLCNLPANCTAVGVPAEVVRINNKAVNPADDLDQQDLPDVMAQRLTELDRRISKLEKDAQGDVPPSIHEVIQKQQR